MTVWLVNPAFFGNITINFIKPYDIIKNRGLISSFSLLGKLLGGSDGFYVSSKPFG